MLWWLVGSRRRLHRLRTRWLARFLALQARGAPSGLNASRARDSTAARSELALYEGNEQARAYRMKGDAARTEGKAKRNAGYIKAAGTLISGGKSLYSKYAGPGFVSTEAGWGMT